MKIKNLKLNQSIFVLVRYNSFTGRNYQHDEKSVICKTCPGENPTYALECRAADHKRQRILHTTVLEAAPEEAKKLSKLYGRVYRRLHNLGFAAGDNAYFFPRDVDVDSEIEKIRKDIDETNVEFKICRGDFSFDIFDLSPEDSRQETLRSLQQRVESSIETLLAALHSADIKEIRKAILSTKNLSILLDQEGKENVEELTSFTARAAKWLKDAADEGDLAVEKVTEEIQNGAARFAGIFAELNEERIAS
jgi:hypothetical protein